MVSSQLKYKMKRDRAISKQRKIVADNIKRKLADKEKLKNKKLVKAAAASIAEGKNNNTWTTVVTKGEKKRAAKARKEAAHKEDAAMASDQKDSQTAQTRTAAQEDASALYKRLADEDGTGRQEKKKREKLPGWGDFSD
ncbi:hypothetical protein DIPPA_28387 [Diplonema papillatum]|nr:hypothetical protein DIPPA_28387 [Diplonema papillatum]